MTCRKCKHDFCWLCLKDWKKHGSATGGYYACNIYEKLKKEDKDFQKQLKVQENSKNEIARYMYNYERYQNHGKSREIAIKQIDQIKSKC
jgi:hypothetical protein